MKSLHIQLTDTNELIVQASEPLTNTIVTDLALSTVLAVMNSAVNSAPEDERQELKELLFNNFNIAASTLLAQFAPDIDLRPDITEQALLNAELDIAISKSESHELSNL